MGVMSPNCYVFAVQLVQKVRTRAKIFERACRLATRLGAGVGATIFFCIFWIIFWHEKTHKNHQSTVAKGQCLQVYFASCPGGGNVCKLQICGAKCDGENQAHDDQQEPTQLRDKPNDLSADLQHTSLNVNVVPNIDAMMFSSHATASHLPPVHTKSEKPVAMTLSCPHPKVARQP